jgi:predicted phosphate transport protein (TIGR00153 family)
MFSIFKTTSTVIGQINEFLDIIDESGLVFRKGIKNYIRKEKDKFLEVITEIDELEERADELRRKIENSLYRKSLLPDLRGDVLQLLENLDDLVDNSKESLVQFENEAPEVPEDMGNDIIELAKTSTEAVASLVLSVRSFFRDPSSVKDNIHRVYYYEKEVDKASNLIKRKLFKENETLDFPHKQHLRHFITHIEKLSDVSEGIADTLNILAIKRSI